MEKLFDLIGNLILFYFLNIFQDKEDLIVFIEVKQSS